MNIKLFATLLVLAIPLQAANLLRGGELGMSNIPDTVRVNSAEKSKWSLVKAAKDAIKKPMSRRICQVTLRNMAFHSMGVLQADRAYEINIYRGKRDPRTLFTSNGADNFNLMQNEKWKLIQATPLGNPNKKLCIAAASNIHKGINNNILKHFVQAIIAAEDETARQNVFKAYKGQIGLPDILNNFTYNVYAWETDYDCALYNIGVPEAFYPEGSVKQTKTDIFSHHADSGRTFAVQVSKVNVNHNPVSIFQLKNDNDGPLSLRLQPFGFFYKSFPELVEALPKNDKIETLTFGENDEKCAAFFYQTESVNVFHSVAQVEKYLRIYNKGGIQSLRLEKFIEDINFLQFLGSFNGSHTVSCAIWLKKNGKCNWSRMDNERSSSDVDSDDDDDYVSERGSDASEITDTEITSNSSYDKPDSDDDEDHLSNDRESLNIRSYSENWPFDGESSDVEADQSSSSSRLVTGSDSDDEYYQSDIDTHVQDSDDD